MHPSNPAHNPSRGWGRAPQTEADGCYVHGRPIDPLPYDRPPNPLSAVGELFYVLRVAKVPPASALRPVGCSSRSWRRVLCRLMSQQSSGVLPASSSGDFVLTPPERRTDALLPSVVMQRRGSSLGAAGFCGTTRLFFWGGGQKQGGRTSGWDVSPLPGLPFGPCLSCFGRLPE